MGIRISKKMGFFLAVEDIGKIFDAAKLEELIDEEISINYQEFKKMCLKFSDEYWVLAMHMDYANVSEFNIFDYICPIYNFDDFAGYLFQPLILQKQNRHDDTMDHYEHMNTHGSITFSVIQIPDNPCCSGSATYIYKNKSAPSDGFLQYGDEFMDVSKVLALHPSYRLKDRPLKALIDDGIIEIKVENDVWAMANMTKCLLPQTNQSKFNHYLKPSIVTSWG